jgi:hypothetical protein
MAAFPDPLGDPEKCPSRALLLDAIKDYTVLDAEAKGGDRGKISTRKAARAKLTAMLTVLAPFLEIAADYRRSTLGLTGYDLKKDARTKPSEAITLLFPQKLRVSHGRFSGLVVATARTVPGASGYEMAWTEGDPTDAATWQQGPYSAGSTHIEIAGRTVGKTLTVRMRAHFGRKGPGSWSGTANIFVT